MTKQTIADLALGFGGYDWDKSYIVIHFDFGKTVARQWEDASHLCYTVSRYEEYEVELDNGMMAIILNVWN